MWTLDAERGQRLALEAPGALMPLISPDRFQIAYRVERDGYAEIWVARWDGQDAHMVASERDLTQEALPENYSERRLQDVRWVPGTEQLALVTIAIPAGTEPMPPKNELWTVDVDGGAPKPIFQLGDNSVFAFSHDGASLAVLKRGSLQDPQGNLVLARADGTGQRMVLEFPANAYGYGSEAQLSWLPDGSALWAAIPDPEAGLRPGVSGVTLHRVSRNGKAEKAGHVQAVETFWSPDGKSLAYTEPVSDTYEVRTLVLARADGSEPQPYATLQWGAFAGWAPDGSRFLYQSEEQFFIGALGEEPQALGAVGSIIDPRWISAEQMLYLLDQGATWGLIAKTVDDEAVTLAELPRDITYDVAGAAD
jgi:Tol biopolymer transport system component